MSEREAVRHEEASGEPGALRLRLSRVCKVYGEGAERVEAVAGVDLALASGECVLLVGPSGSGKTTLLMLMGCLLRPSEGRVWVDGIDAGDLDAAARAKLRLGHLGFVFQGFNLFPALSAQENVELVLNLRGIRGAAAESEAARQLARVGLSHRLRHKPADLSGGEKQRVAVARALAAEAPILLADEPTASLDGATGYQVTELLRRLAREEGRAVFVVTHDPRIVDLGDRVLHMEDGRIVREERR